MVRTDLSGYTKQTDFIAYKNKMQRDLGNYATASQLMTLKVNVVKNYLLKKDLDVTNIKNNLAVLMGRGYFTGTDGMLKCDFKMKRSYLDPP